MDELLEQHPLKERPKVYIAGPYSQPDQCVNTHNAMLVWSELWMLGYCPYCPHWTHFQHTFSPLPAKDWYEYDSYWLDVCDIVLRLPGTSLGPDNEVKLASHLNIPIVYTINELLSKMPIK